MAQATLEVEGCLRASAGFSPALGIYVSVLWLIARRYRTSNRAIHSGRRAVCGLPPDIRSSRSHAARLQVTVFVLTRMRMWTSLARAGMFSALGFNHNWQAHAHTEYARCLPTPQRHTSTHRCTSTATDRTTRPHTMDGSIAAARNGTSTSGASPAKGLLEHQLLSTVSAHLADCGCGFTP